MPTYDYRCDACGHRFEEIQKITDPAVSKCPSCGENAAKRLISATAFHLKGGGWYKTDYASGSSSTPNSSTTASDSAKESSAEAPKPAAETTVSTAKPAAESKPKAVD